MLWSFKTSKEVFMRSAAEAAKKDSDKTLVKDESAPSDIKSSKTVTHVQVIGNDEVRLVSELDFGTKEDDTASQDTVPRKSQVKKLPVKLAEQKSNDSALARKSMPKESDRTNWYKSTGIRFQPDNLADSIANTEHLYYTGGQFIQYQSGVYRSIKDIAVKKMIRQSMKKGTIRSAQINDAFEQLRIEAQLDAEELNKDANIINVRNGLYNVEDDRLMGHTEDYISTVQLGVNYDPEADCPRFRRFLDEALGEEQTCLMQEILGYLLVPEIKAQMAFILVGKPAAGKSVLLQVVEDILLGRENVSHISWQNLSDRFKTAELFGKLANIFADLPSKDIGDNDIFKAIVGGDSITVERKNQQPFSFQCYARMLFSCNRIPISYGDTTEGLYRRLTILRFDRTVPPEQRDPDLLDKFKEEADGIFLFALEGLKRLRENQYRFTETQIGHDELQRYKEASNTVLAFVKNCCRIKAGEKASKTKTYEHYEKYCATLGYCAETKTKFNRVIRENFPTVRDSRTEKFWVWKGLSLRSSEGD